MVGADPGMAAMLAYSKARAQQLNVRDRRWLKELEARVAKAPEGRDRKRAEALAKAFRAEFEFWERRR